MGAYFLQRNAVSPNCGPGTHNKMLTTVGSRDEVTSLDATGDTWQFEPVTNPILGHIFGSGTWEARLQLRHTGFGGDVRCVVAHYAEPSGCAVLNTMIDETISVPSLGFTEYLYQATDVPQIHMAEGELILCIVYMVIGGCQLEHSQPGPFGVTQVNWPTAVTHRPYEYYKRQRRRRSA